MNKLDALNDHLMTHEEMNRKRTHNTELDTLKGENASAG